MKRTAFDDRRDQQTADEFLAPMAPCAFCGQSAERETLSQYGGRCGACFGRYVSRGRPNPPAPTREARIAALNGLRGVLGGPAHPLGWAHRLQAREAAGERLSLAQRQAWRSVLKPGIAQDVPA